MSTRSQLKGGVVGIERLVSIEIDVSIERRVGIESGVDVGLVQVR